MRVQARQTVVYARAGALGWNGPWRDAVTAGASVLLSRGLRPDGGTHHMLGPDGATRDERRDLYDLAFVLFALAEAGHALNRADLLAHGEALVDWLDQNWADAAGGFLEWTKDGTELNTSPVSPANRNPAAGAQD